MAAVLVALVAIDTAITGWLLARHVNLTKTVAQLGGIVQELSNDVAVMDVQIGLGRDDA